MLGFVPLATNPLKKGLLQAIFTTTIFKFHKDIIW